MPRRKKRKPKKELRHIVIGVSIADSEEYDLAIQALTAFTLEHKGIANMFVDIKQMEDRYQYDDDAG